jgi:para-nitrobenzyl esterase
MYEFAWRSQILGDTLGACHALELPFVFDTLKMKDGQALTGDGAPQSLADSMHGAWVQFIDDGDPGWPKYEIDSRATARFDHSLEVVTDPRPEERAAWAGVR